MALTPYQQLEQEFRRLHAFRSAASILRWDSAVMMPRGSSDLRGEQLAALETESHSLLTSPRVSRLLARADWVIANDSGPMHLAAALGVRVLGIFGPTDPRLFGPYPLNAPSNVVVQAPVGDLKLLSAKEVYTRFQKARARFK